MKILIAGGCSFIGSHIADRFYKEGHKIFIIDNPTVENEKNVVIKHKLYSLDISSEKCEDIFKTNRFDVVIYSPEEGDIDNFNVNPASYKSNLLSVLNMLNLSSKYEVKKFVFVSSVGVYGNSESLPLKEEDDINPMTPYAMSKHIGEFYCEKWLELYGLNTVCLRISNVFGPRQLPNRGSGVISEFLEKSIKSECINIYGDGEQSRDFIYVEDVVDAIYKVVEKDITGIINISANDELTINQLVNELRKFKSIESVIYKDNDISDIKKIKVDNTRAKELLGWKPKYSFTDGLEKTYKWYEKYLENIKDVSIKKEVNPTIGKIKKCFLKVIPYLEHILAVIILYFIATKSGYKNVSPIGSLDLCFVYIVSMGIVYGLKQSIISMVLSSSLYLYLVLELGIDIIAILYESKYILHIAYYIIIAFIVGYKIEKDERKLYSKEMQRQALEERYFFLENLYNETRIIKDNLQKQIINSEDSFASIYNTVKALNSLRVEQVYSSAVGILEKLLNTNTVSIYSVSKDARFLRLKGKSYGNNFSLPFSIKVDEYKELENVVQNKKIFTNRMLNKGLPKMVAPIVEAERGKVVALICIHELEFDDLTLYNENLFKVLVDLISESITKAYKYDEAIAKEKYLQGTEMLLTKEFEAALQDKIELKKAQGIEFTLIKSLKVPEDYEDIYNKLAVLVRNDDLIGIGSDDYIYVILSNTEESSAKMVIDRLALKNIKAELIGASDENV